MSGTKKCGGTNSQPGKWDSPEDRKIKTVLDLEIPLQPLHIQRQAVQIDLLSRKRECMYRELIENERILTEHLIEKMIGGTNQ